METKDTTINNAPKTISDNDYKNSKPTIERSMTTALLKKNGIMTVSDADLFYKFRRYPVIDPNNHMGLTREFVFFTKPNLQIFNGGSGDTSGWLRDYLIKQPIFQDAYYRYPEVLKALSYSAYTANPFNTLLSNSVSANIDLPDISVSNDYETGKTILGSSIFYRGNSYESDENFDFSVEFTDSRNLDVYMWFKLFDEYERLKHLGRVTQNISSDDLNTYIYDKKIHDQFSLYKFIVSEDGESIVHYSKFTGVYPKSVPRASFGDMPADGVFKFTVNFKAVFVEDMNPVIIGEFNKLSKKLEASTPNMAESGFVPEYDGWTGDWMYRPIITLKEPTNNVSNGELGRFERRSRYKLKWYNYDTDDFLETIRNQAANTTGTSDLASTTSNVTTYK